MPEAFERCVESGGRVRTKTLSGGRFQRICFDDDGNAHPGEVKVAESRHEADGHRSRAVEGELRRQAR